MKVQSFDGYGNFIILQKKCNPWFIFPVICQESPIFWQLKLDSGISNLKRWLALSDGFYAGQKAATLQKLSWVTPIEETNGSIWYLITLA